MNFPLICKTEKQEKQNISKRKEQKPKENKNIVRKREREKEIDTSKVKITNKPTQYRS